MNQKLIAFVGLRRSGKDTAALALMNEGWQLIKFADALKEMLRTYFRFVGLRESEIEARIEGELKEQSTPMLCGQSTRWAMQTLGTEWGRKLIGNNLWVQAAMARAMQYPRVVISDCRFPNEAQAIQAQGGKIIRIVRDGLVIDAHPSEQLIESLPTDFTIFNDGTIDDLQQKVLELTNNES